MKVFKINKSIFNFNGCGSYWGIASFFIYPKIKKLYQYNTNKAYKNLTYISLTIHIYNNKIIIYNKDIK